MSNYVSLSLHTPEETVTCDFAAALVPYPVGVHKNPIADYFATSNTLIQKIVSTKYGDDAEVLGLLVLGVVSCSEFYFRSILSELTRLCPICEQHIEAINIPAGSIRFYEKTAFPAAMSAFEHESLADSKKIATEIKRFVGVTCADNSSVKSALEDFEKLCELRHCFVHARGFAGLKATRAMGGPRALQKVLIQRNQALDFIKIAHNAVRAVNRYLSDEVLNRWVDRDVLVGQWKKDKRLFTALWMLFTVAGEDAYAGSTVKAYSLVKPLILKRRQAIAAKVAAAP